MLLRLLYKLVLSVSLVPILASLAFSQTAEKNPLIQEFPVILQRALKAGKTGVGTKIEAKLSVATLVNGKVVPRDAIFSGEVVESEAKHGEEPSRLSICLRSVTWKEGSAVVNAYLTAWYYPTVTVSGPDLQYGPGQSPTRNWNYGAGEYPNPNSPSYKPFPTSDTGKDSGVPTASSTASTSASTMKDVEMQQVNGDRLVLVSKRSNIALDRMATYVAVAGNLSALK